jgi:hypothetical protein
LFVLEAKIIGTTASANTSMAVLRAALTVQPRLISDDDSQPPPMLQSQPQIVMRFFETGINSNRLLIFQNRIIQITFDLKR